MTFDVEAARKWAQFDSDTDRLLLAACDEIERLEAALREITEMSWTEPDDEAKGIARRALGGGE